MPEIADTGQDKRTNFTSGTVVALSLPDIQGSICNSRIEGDLNVNQHGTILGGRPVCDVRCLQKSSAARGRVPDAVPVVWV